MKTVDIGVTMFEFIDMQIVAAVGLLMGLLLINIPKPKNEKQEKRGVHKLILIGLISIPVLAALTDSKDAQANIEKFKSDAALICSTNGSEYLVSKKENWDISEYYFKKESLIIRADRCEGK